MNMNVLKGIAGTFLIILTFVQLFYYNVSYNFFFVIENFGINFTIGLILLFDGLFGK